MDPITEQMENVMLIQDTVQYLVQGLLQWMFVGGIIAVILMAVISVWNTRNRNRW